MERVVQSIGQDCIYAVSRGNVIPVKHMLLPWGVKSLTGNLSRCSITLVMEFPIQSWKRHTALCLQKQTQEADQGIVFPSSCHPHIPTSLAFDNIDKLEETLSGGDTSHRVNGIIIQSQVHTVKPPETAPQILTKKKCSVTPIPLDIPEYNAGSRVGPPVMKPQTWICKTRRIL